MTFLCFVTPKLTLNGQIYENCESNTRMGKKFRFHHRLAHKNENSRDILNLICKTMTLAMACLISISYFSNNLAQAKSLKFELVPEKSFIAVAAYRSGLFGFLGHNHGILAKKWSANLCLDQERLENSSAHIEVPTEFLEIDSSEALVKAGLDSKGPGPDDRKKIRETMLGPDYLDMRKYPEIVFESKKVEYDQGRSRLTGLLLIRGKARPVSFLINRGSDDKNSVTFTGDLKIKQTEFGMEPQSVAGVVNVADELLIRFWITAVLTQSNCKPRT